MGGDVDLADVGSHTVTIHTSGGNIRASGVTAQNVTASTSGGDIILRQEPVTQQ